MFWVVTALFFVRAAGYLETAWEEHDSGGYVPPFEYKCCDKARVFENGGEWRDTCCLLESGGTGPPKEICRWRERTACSLNLAALRDCYLNMYTETQYFCPYECESRKDVRNDPVVSFEQFYFMLRPYSMHIRITSVIWQRR